MSNGHEHWDRKAGNGRKRPNIDIRAECLDDRDSFKKLRGVSWRYSRKVMAMHIAVLLGQGFWCSFGTRPEWAIFQRSAI